MFKGLRTKIESEQKGQNNSKPKQRTGQVGRTSELDYKSSQPQLDILTNNEIIANPNPSSGSDLSRRRAENAENVSTNIPRNELPNINKPGPSINVHYDNLSNTSIDSATISQPLTGNSSANSRGNKTINELDSQIDRLREQLRTVIKERDEISRQKEHSYQLIGALEKNLEQHKATNISLETKLSEYELKLKEQKTEHSDRTTISSANNLFSKAFDPRGHIANTSDSSISDNVEVLRHEIIELQVQLAKKNRQLKIRQQNLTDMKKALQKEILDHGRTQKELARLQKQLKNEEETAVSVCDDRDGTTSGKKTMSESNLNESNDTLGHKTNRGPNHHDAASDMKLAADDGQKAPSLHAGGNIADDTMSLNAAPGTAAVQFDRISCLSRSSASVDDFESTDLQHSNSNNNNGNNKEVSHEYLRNVLFRYMTSTDSETTQHLVKAISVLMDFTPEQSAAIKSSMNGRMSSWLRLK